MKIKTLQIFTDYVCPWCYLGQARLKKVISKYKIKLDIIHFPLHPDTPKAVSYTHLTLPTTPYV